MKIKKSIAILSIAFVLCIILAIVVLFNPLQIKPIANKDSISVSTSTPKIQTCEPYTNISTVVKSEDSKRCDCLKSDTEKAQCGKNIFDATIYNKALAESNLELCKSITSIIIKDACTKVVNEKINYLNKK